MYYGIHETELWCRYARIAIESGDLAPLVLVDTLPLETRPISWVADLSRLSQSTMKDPVMLLSKKTSYSKTSVRGEYPGQIFYRHDRQLNASRTTKSSAHFSDDGTVLCIEGISVDKVEEMTSMAKPNSEEDVHFGAIEKMGLKYDVEKDMWDEAVSIAFRNTEGRSRAEKVRVWEEHESLAIRFRR